MHSPSESRLQRWLLPFILVSVAGLVLLFGGWGAYEFIPSVHFQAQSAWAQVHQAIAPQPENLPTAAPMVSLATLAPSSSSAAPVMTATPTPPAGSTSTATRVVRTATPTITPVPARHMLTGFKHEYQLFNNCGPASLSINLSYWGWQGSQKNTATILKPNQDDKNVSPRELYEYLLTQKFDAYIRVGGDVETLKRFIAAGYPVMVEKGFTCAPGEARCSGWFGHYSVFSGYDDATETFILQDSFRGPNLKMTYAEALTNWRAFNYLYFIVFSAGEAQDAKVQTLLGEAVDLDQNYRDALARAQEEALTLTGQDAAFAWFNVGTNLAALRDYAGAAAAYDQARQIGLPYRMAWYQFGPYRAYYQMARYHDVIDLATFAINSVTPGVVPGLEEAYYWRGQAEEAIGEPDQAIADYRTALQRHPGYDLAEEALRALGETP